jgi:hypothetical protein
LTSSAVASWAVFRLKHDGHQCWGVRKSDGGPEHKNKNRSAQVMKEETKNLWKHVLASKVVNPFTRALAPPFIGRRRDFLHLENTLWSRVYS